MEAEEVSFMEELEIWADIKEFPTYQVSTNGRVRRIYKYASPLIYKQSLHYRGYLLVTLSLLAGETKIKKTCKVHRLVASAFCTGEQPGLVVNHKNGIKTDNRSLNLEWVTPKQNTDHAVKNGLYQCGIERKNAKLKEKDVLEIRKKYAGGQTQASLAREYKIGSTTIFFIVHNKKWKHV